jgi:putative transport protein
LLGKSLSELEVLPQNDVTITRVSRAEVEFTPNENFELHFGDTVLAVGELESIERVMAVMGNSTKRLNHPQLIPVFVGIVLGIIVGSIPVKFPGMPAPVKLGLAGGPLLVAIILSRIGRIGPLNYFMPISANFMLRELGISLFLACVGLKAGDSFVATLQGDGMMWMGYGALITAVPLLIVGFVARVFMKMNFMNLCGLLAGSMTDPPALAFATSVAGNESPSVAYATVYPLTMILRVLYAQTLILLLANAIS